MGGEGAAGKSLGAGLEACEGWGAVSVGEGKWITWHAALDLVPVLPSL